MVEASTVPGVERRPIVSGRVLPRADRPTWKERLAVLTIRRPGRKLPRYLALAERFLATGRPALAIELLLMAPRTVRRRASTLILLRRACAQAGDQVRALAALTAARVDHPRSAEILVDLSTLHRNAAEFGEAHRLLLAAEALGSDQSMRRVMVETALRDLAAGRESLRRVLATWRRSPLRSAPLVHDVSVHYPELAADIASFRAELRESILSDACGLSPSDRIRTALRCRMVDEAQRIHAASMARGLALDDRTQHAYAGICKAVEPLGDLARLASENEGGNVRRVAALVDGKPTRIDATTHDPRAIVELFIPNAFYRPEEAQTAIVQAALLVMAERVSRRGIALVPRHQFDLRHCRPLLCGKVISFHTRGEDDRRHLRFKDGALADYITIDHRGYAGFASIATDFAEIHRTVAGVSRDDLRRNQAALYAALAEQGRSKHRQPAAAATFKGRYVFVALQKADDEVTELVSMSSVDLLRHVARLYRGTGTLVVTKRHPYCKSYAVQAAMQDLENQGLVVTSAASIHSLIGKAEVVFTANSGVGLEALVHGRPVVVSGLAEYAYAAARVRDAADLARAIAEAKQMAQRGAEFLYFYTHRYGFNASDTRRLEQRVDDWLDQPLDVAP